MAENRRDRPDDLVPVQWQTEGPLGSPLNAMPDESFPADPWDAEEG